MLWLPRLNRKRWMRLLCCITNDDTRSDVPWHVLLSHTFCGSHVWVWLSWISQGWNQGVGWAMFFAGDSSGEGCPYKLPQVFGQNLFPCDFMIADFFKASVLECESCHNKTPPIRWLKQWTCVFSQSWKPDVWGQGVHRLVSSGFWIADGYTYTVLSLCVPGVSLYVLNSSSYKVTY